MAVRKMRVKTTRRNPVTGRRETTHVWKVLGKREKVQPALRPGQKVGKVGRLKGVVYPTSTRDESGQTVFPWTGMTLEEARRIATKYHFIKEALTKSERELLTALEGAIRVLDEENPGGARY